MTRRGRTTPLVLVGTMALVLFCAAQFAQAQSSLTYKELLLDITEGRMVNAGRVSIDADSIVKEDEPLLVTIDIAPTATARDELVELHLLMSEGPWPRAYTVVLQSHDGNAHFATRVRVKESCVLHAIAEVDGEDLFEATQEVKVSAGAYVH